MNQILFWLCLWPGLPDAEAAPQLDDLKRFPAQAVAQDMAAFGRAHVAWVEGEAALSPWESHWCAWRCEAKQCLAAWEALERAHESEEERLQALADLKDLLGQEDYFAGVMPPPAPVWRFRRVP